MNKNILLTMLLLMATMTFAFSTLKPKYFSIMIMLLLMETMAFAACTGKKSSLQKDSSVQTDSFKTKSGK